MASGIKTGGRQKGTPNVLTKELRNVLNAVLQNELNELPATLQQLEAKERVHAVIKLASFVLPKIRDEHYSFSEPMDWS